MAFSTNQIKPVVNIGKISLLLLKLWQKNGPIEVNHPVILIE